MRKTRLSLLLLASLAGCIGGRTPLLDPPQAKPDANLRTPDAGVDRQPDQGPPDTKPAPPDVAPDLAPDRPRPDAALPDTSPDRAADLPNPDTRPPTPDLAPDRATDLRAPDVRLPDTGPLVPDVVPDRPQDVWSPDTLPLQPDLAPDRAQDARSFDDLARDTGLDLVPDLPPLDGPVFDLSPDLAPDLLADAGPDMGSGDVHGDTMAGCLPGTPYPLVLGGDQRLYRFDPATLALFGIADVTCGDYSLNSMTASPLGRAYISNSGGQLCSLDVRTFETALTPFDPNSIGNISYGMALLSDSTVAKQSLYVATNNGSSAELKTINLTSYTLGDIAAIVPTIPMVELTAGPSNGLFALYPGQPSSLLHLDPLTANSISTVTLPNVASPGGFALVYWEDSLYLFMGDVTDTMANDVYRYRISDGQITLAGTLPVSIIGAGVALCQ